MTDGLVHDVNVLDLLPLEADAFYIMDRGYIDWSRLYRIHQVQAFFVMWAKQPHFPAGVPAPSQKDKWIGGAHDGGLSDGSAVDVGTGPRIGHTIFDAKLAEGMHSSVGFLPLFLDTVPPTIEMR